MMTFTKTITGLRVSPKAGYSNVRKTANVTSAVVHVLKKGTCLIASGYMESIGGFKWYGVTNPEDEEKVRIELTK